MSSITTTRSHRKLNLSLMTVRVLSSARLNSVWLSPGNTEQGATDVNCGTQKRQGEIQPGATDVNCTTQKRPAENTEQGATDANCGTHRREAEIDPPR